MHLLLVKPQWIKFSSDSLPIQKPVLQDCNELLHNGVSMVREEKWIQTCQRITLSQPPLRHCMWCFPLLEKLFLEYVHLTAHTGKQNWKRRKVEASMLFYNHYIQDNENLSQWIITRFGLQAEDFKELSTFWRCLKFLGICQ